MAHFVLMLFYLLHSHNYKLVFGVSMLTLDKGQRLLYGDSLMTHAMVFTGFSWEVSKQQDRKELGVSDLITCRRPLG